MAQSDNKLRIPETLRKVKNIVGIFSAKGGVGKSAISLQIALALRDKGFSVGLVDADIYGPSQPIMLGSSAGELKLSKAQVIEPLTKEGIKFISMGLISGENMPVIWRGPMVSGAVMQLLSQTEWGELDYLIVDTPPGTGDIQLTISQKIDVTGALIITTPQELSLLDVKRGVNMFRKVNLPIIGVVENMSYFLCPSDGEKYAIFGQGGGEKESARLGVPLIGQIPIEMQTREAGDSGNPIALGESETAKEFKNVAEKIIASLN